MTEAETMCGVAPTSPPSTMVKSVCSPPPAATPPARAAGQQQGAGCWRMTLTKSRAQQPGPALAK